MSSTAPLVAGLMSANSELYNVETFLRKLLRCAEDKVARKSSTQAANVNKNATAFHILNRADARNELCPINNLKLPESNADKFRPLCPVKLNGHPSYALIDSGNVVFNAISERFARELFGTDDISQHIKPLAECKYIGTAEKGAKLRVLGITKQPLTLRFGGTTMKYYTSPIVIRGLTMDINISGPFLAEHGIDQIHSQGAIKVKVKLVRIVTYKTARRDIQKLCRDCLHKNTQATNEQQSVCHISTPTRDVIRYAYVAQMRVIPANSVAYIPLHIPDIENRKMSDCEGIVEVTEKFADKCLGHPTLRTAVKTFQRGKCFASILNLTEENIEISEGKCFGTFTPGIRVPKELNKIGKINSMQEQIGKKTSNPDEKLRPRTVKEKTAWIEEEFKLKEATWLKGNAKAYKRDLDLFLEIIDILSFNNKYVKTKLFVNVILI